MRFPAEAVSFANSYYVQIQMIGNLNASVPTRQTVYEVDLFCVSRLGFR